MKTPEHQTLQPPSSSHLDQATQNTTNVPQVEVRRLTDDDIRPYFDLIIKNKTRLSSPKHKMNLESLYGSPEGLKAHLDNGEERMGIWKDGELVGGIDTIGITDRLQEVSYWLDEQSIRQGIGLAALELVVARKNNEGIDLVAEVEPDNFGSMNLLDQTGFREKGFNANRRIAFSRRVR